MPCVLLIQFQSARGFHSFPSRECQKSLLGFVRYNCKLNVSKLRTISLPLGQKTSRLVAPFSFLVNYRQISIFSKPWLPIQREKRGGYSLEIIYKRLEIVFFGEGVATIMSTGYSSKSSFKDCRRPGEICLNLRRDVRYAGSSLRQEIEKNEILACSYWKCE